MRFSRAMRQNLKRTPSVITWHSQPVFQIWFRKIMKTHFVPWNHDPNVSKTRTIRTQYMGNNQVCFFNNQVFWNYAGKPGNLFSTHKILGFGFSRYIYIYIIYRIYIYNHIYLIDLPRFSPHRRTAPAEAWGSEPPKTWSPMRSPSPSHWTWCWRSRWLRDPLQEPGREIALRYTFVRFC
jgi:hypothetical protein